MIVKKSPINQGFPDLSIVNFFTKRSDKEYFFLDIETTGFAPSNSQLYLIGCTYFSENSWFETQWFAETFEDESRILQSFLEFLPENSYIITYNGSTFDFPYLIHKQNQFELASRLSEFSFFDLYKVLKPYKQLLNFSHFRQQDLEKFVEYDRKSDISGKKCISLYQQFLRTEETSLSEILLRHNQMDLIGMLRILPLLSYAQLTQGSFQIQSYTFNQEYLTADCILERPMPKPIKFSDELLVCTGSGQEFQVLLPLKKGKLRKFYHNYKDYDYLPAEDMAIHRSLSSYMAKNKKKRATPKTCYTWFECNSTALKNADILRDCLAEYFQLLAFGHLIPH